ncbi:MAG: carbamoyltransferase HypF [Coriobacteriales bacterium]|jgi:hydrogenase maturation protein HypF|nr:carbamoyltransferase HypF [Coriobacteriales bacterium]
MTEARDLHICGIVQGVGFRPFVYRQATAHGLTGWVLNASDGVHIHLEGEKRALDDFIHSLPTCAPSASKIISIEVKEGSVEGSGGFFIRESDKGGKASTFIAPDIATCPECLRELLDPANRRFHYPFINCTNCGPRFTIINALPYDRPHTSMADFTMCEACDTEYHDPANRRFHAQPDACFDCGPMLRLWRSGHTATRATNREESDALIEQAASMLAQGHILAIKSLGGYHLACDATNSAAVALLRTRKRRTQKPLALMVRTLADASTLCEVNATEEALLCGTVRPIVLLERKAKAKTGAAIAHSVAGTLHELGIMLPSTPVHHLLMALVKTPLVMTSGNMSEEPIISEETEAHELLAGVADAFLDNDREILSRYDDSVTRVVGERVYLIRRARGYAPEPLPFSQPLPLLSPLRSELTEQNAFAATPATPHIFATGPEQKNTFCLVRDGEAFISQHLGDLENASAFKSWLSTLGLYQRIFDLDYQLLACDTHPEYLSTKWARAQDEARIEVQHHHAHIASVLAEHRATDSTSADDHSLIDRVIGIAFDGTGYGDDATIWGGEVLIATLEDYERFAHLRPVLLPGGRAAIDHPDRMAWSYLRTFGLTEHKGAFELANRIGEDRILLLDQIIANHINTPETSSMGRLFDAVSALANICTESSYEGQAAVELEAALYDPATERPATDPEKDVAQARYHFAIKKASEQEKGAEQEKTPTQEKASEAAYVIDASSVFTALLDDHANHVPATLISLRFHEATVQLIAALCALARARYGLSTVALSGGVFMNRYLLTKVVPLLESEGFTVLLNRALPANDGCISYGQAAVAAARFTQLADRGILLGS